MTFAELVPGAVARVVRVGGEGAFRRRLMELGILPGTEVRFVGVAPLGDPLELLVRGASLSIRRAEAERVEVIPLPLPLPVTGTSSSRSNPDVAPGDRQGHEGGAPIRGRARGRA